jgi:hypothetical protein
MSEKKSANLPEFLKPYFWDVDFEKLELKSDSFFVTKRVIDRGDTTALRFVLKTYGVEMIKQVVLKTRDLSRPTGNFWAEILELDKSTVPCLQKPYSPIHFGLSS